MAESKDTLLRQITLLGLIPHQPKFLATSTLLEKLHEKGFTVSLRTLQRDLVSLSCIFALQSDDQASGRRWSYLRDAPISLSTMDIPTALALHLAKDHLRPLLPQIVLDQLTPHFNRANEHLNSLQRNGLAHWARCVRAVPNGKALMPAQIDERTWHDVSTALMERKQLKVSYLSRSKSEHKILLLHPAGIVSRHSVSYLIASVEGYDDLRQFALHRFQSTEPLDQPARETPQMDIDRYISKGALNSTGENTLLRAQVSPQIAWLLRETPLSQEQELESLPNSDWHQLSAQVPKDQETLWWLFSLGENVRVQQPQDWVDAIKQRLNAAQTLYNSPV